MIAWQVDNPWTFEPPDDALEAARASKYGIEYSLTLIQWLTTLRWPTEAEQDTRGLPTGISWHELAINFMITTQRFLPINIATSRAPRFTCREETPELDITVYTFATMVNAFRHSVEHLQFLLDKPVAPTLTGQRIRAQQILFGGLVRNGLASRPAMWRQTDTMKVVIEYGVTIRDYGTEPHFHHPDIPEIPATVSHEPYEPEEESTQARAARYHLRRMVLKQRHEAAD